MNYKGKRKATQTMCHFDRIREILVGLELNPLYEANPLEKKQIAEYLRILLDLKRMIKRRHTNLRKLHG